jgi:hypothetical protein
MFFKALAAAPILPGCDVCTRTTAMLPKSGNASECASDTWELFKIKLQSLSGSVCREGGLGGRGL